MTHECGAVHCKTLEIDGIVDGSVRVCLTEYPGLRAQIAELMPRRGDLIAITYVGDNQDGSKRFAVDVTRATS